MGIETKVVCLNCQQEAEFSKMIASDGAIHVITFCFNCNSIVWHNGQRYAYPKSSFTKEEIETLPIAIDYGKRNLCEYEGCNRTDVQWHHFGPQSVVPDSDDWPGAWLCRAHHATWHALITPTMNQGGMYMRVCPNCGHQINSMAVVPKFNDQPQWVFWGTEGNRWKVCDCEEQGFVHFRVRLSKGHDQHRLALIEGTRWVDTMKPKS